jgi:hypothetical protein
VSLFDMAFGCWHKQCSFPMTVRGKLRRTTLAAAVTGTYVVCLDSGHEFPYDWSRMKTLASKPRNGWAAKPALSFPASRWLEAPCPPFARNEASHTVWGAVLLFPGRETQVPLL